MKIGIHNNIISNLNLKSQNLNKQPALRLKSLEYDTVSFSGKNKQHKKEKPQKTEPNKTFMDTKITIYKSQDELEEKISGLGYYAIHPITYEILGTEETISTADVDDKILITYHKDDAPDENSLKDFIEAMRQENTSNVVLKAFSEKSVIGPVRQGMFGTSIQTIMDLMRRDNPNADFMCELFEEVGIKNNLQFANLLNIYQSKQCQSVFNSNNLEFIKCYGILNDKRNMLKYPELILSLYLDLSNSEENNDYSLINTYVNFLSNAGINSASEYRKKFAHLEGKFNHLEAISDIRDSIEYVYQTYDDKIKLLEDELKDIKTDSKKKNARAIYSAEPDVIDYLYNENNGESLGDIKELVKFIGNNNISTSTTSAVAPYFNGLQTTGDKVEFYRFLNNFKIDPKDLKQLSKKSIVSEAKILDNFKNYSVLTDVIKKTQNINEAEAQKTYANFKEIMNSLYDRNVKDTQEIGHFLKFTKNNNIQDSFGFLRFYNNFNNTKKTELTSSEIADFMDLAKFAPGYNFSLIPSGEKSNIFRYLTKERENFNNLKPEIEKFLNNNTSSFFVLNTPFQVYVNYKNALVDTPDNISNTLSEIAQLDAKSSEEYRQKEDEFKKFQNFFESRDKTLLFLKRNNIGLDENDKEYRENCIKILKVLNKKSTPSEVLEYYKDSDFLKRTKSSLPYFCAPDINQNNLAEILCVCARKKIGTLGEFQNYIEKNHGTINDCKGLIEHIKRLPENISFAENCKLLKALQLDIKSNGFYFEITNKNILNIKTEDFLNGKCNPAVINALLGVREDINPVSTFKKAFVELDARRSKFCIAEEIANRFEHMDESYANITYALGISKHALNSFRNTNYQKMKLIEKNIPDDFVDFINSDNWLYKQNGKCANLSLHAKLRLIDRYFLCGNRKISDLYTKEAQNEIRNFLTTIYTKKPNKIKMSIWDSNYIAEHEIDNKRITSIFANDGTMVTIYPAS